jgi:uncharacterized OB-fold protein
MTRLSVQPDGIPLPNPTELTAPHWEATRNGELRVQRCENGHYVFIPLPACNYCYSRKLEWAPTSGKGTLYSMTIVHRPQTPAFQVPYVVAIVQMEEGWYMMSNVVDAELEDVKIGMPLQVTFHKMSDEITLPYFRPA